MICLIAAGCYAQSLSNPQSVGGDFGRNWIAGFKAQNPQPAEPNLKNDLWTWGSSPKGSIVVNGNLLPDPYYIWKSFNYTGGWLGKIYVDPATGYPVYGFLDPYTGIPIYYYMDPKTGKPVYTNAHLSYEMPYYDSVPFFGSLAPYYSPDYLPIGYALPPIFH